jgi:hypothetical protein
VIEGISILVVGLIAGLVFVATRLNSRSIWASAQEERKHWEDRIAGHEEKLRLAREQRWDEVMVGLTEERLSEARRQLARLNAAESGASRQNPGR